MVEEVDPIVLFVEDECSVHVSAVRAVSTEKAHEDVVPWQMQARASSCSSNSNIAEGESWFIILEWLVVLKCWIMILVVEILWESKIEMWERSIWKACQTVFVKKKRKSDSDVPSIAWARFVRRMETRLVKFLYQILSRVRHVEIFWASKRRMRGRLPPRLIEWPLHKKKSRCRELLN